MSYSIDANLLLYAANADAPEHASALRFIQERASDSDFRKFEFLEVINPLS